MYSKMTVFHFRRKFPFRSEPAHRSKSAIHTCTTAFSQTKLVTTDALTAKTLQVAVESCEPLVSKELTVLHEPFRQLPCPIVLEGDVGRQLCAPALLPRVALVDGCPTVQE